jgi:hypothetical protein
MSSYISFYKLNSREGREHLYDDLISTAKFETSFSTYILDRESEYGKSFKITYDQVLSSVLNDFDQIRPSELWEIVQWYEQLAYSSVFGVTTDWEKNEETLSTMLKNSGIEVLYDFSGSSTSNWAFIAQYRNFDKHFPLNAFHEDDYSNIKSNDFIGFLEYIVLLMCKLNEAGMDDFFDYSKEYSDSTLSEIERIKFTYEDDIKLHEVINDAFEEIKIEWIEYNARDENKLNRWFPPVAHTVHDVYYFLTASLKMIESIKEENKNIVMIHGY